MAKQIEVIRFCEEIHTPSTLPPKKTGKKIVSLCA